MPIPENKSINPCLADKRFALFLSGGGARGAYQVGAMGAVLDILNPARDSEFKNPFHILSGTSAGAINACAYAARAQDPMLSMDRLRYFWSALHTGDVYRSDIVGIFGNGFKWISLLLFGWANQWLRSNTPRSLFNNSPLRDLLETAIDFNYIDQNLADQVIQALVVTATSYTNGNHYTMYQANHCEQTWHAWRRQALPQKINPDHLMATSAIPFIFPAQDLYFNGEQHWCGDGSMRQLAPLSPSIHLGADRILVISSNTKYPIHSELPVNSSSSKGYPSLAQLGGHALADIFVDGLAMDIERIHRINYLLAKMPQEVAAKPNLKNISVLTLNSSKDIDEIAMSHLHSLPRAVRAFLRVLGVSAKAGNNSGGIVASYLIFEQSYTQALIDLAYQDTMKRADDIRKFFSEGEYGEKSKHEFSATPQ